jgi:hypothetical protein
MKAFFGLNEQLNKIIQAYRARIDLLVAIECNALEYGLFCCRSLKISGNKQVQIGKALNFATLQAVRFEHMDLETVQVFMEQLPMCQLESIEIINLNSYGDLKSTHRKVWLSILEAGCNRLRYLDLPRQFSSWETDELSFDLPALKYATFDGMSGNKMLSLLRHMPNLYYCKVDLYNPIDALCMMNVCLPKLTYFHIKGPFDWSFEDFCRLFTISPHLKHLTLDCHTHEESMVKPTMWQTLIEQYLPDLIALKLQLTLWYYLTDPEDNLQSFDNDEYWLRRYPYFQVLIKTRYDTESSNLSDYLSLS